MTKIRSKMTNICETDNHDYIETHNDEERTISTCCLCGDRRIFSVHDMTSRFTIDNNGHLEILKVWCPTCEKLDKEALND